MAKEEPLTHEEIWDDSALIDSWNQALDEYKKYHSIHAKGGSLEDLQQAEESSRQTEPSLSATAQPQSTSAHVPTEESGETSKASVDASQGLGATAPGPAPPQVLLGNVQDENLKKLLMAWYYAGYYTGLFEGQQQGPRQGQQNGQGS